VWGGLKYSHPGGASHIKPKADLPKRRLDQLAVAAGDSLASGTSILRSTSGTNYSILQLLASKCCKSEC